MPILRFEARRPAAIAHRDPRCTIPGPVPGPTDDDEAAVLAANRAFYEAFEAQDLDAMSDLWVHDDEVSCVHPGWAALRGWGAVSASWVALFRSSAQLQFILTEARVRVVGDAAWVTLDENILGGSAGSTVAAINVFTRTDGRWRLVAHHGSPVAREG